MKAIVYEGPNKLNYTDVPDVTPAEGEVKLSRPAVSAEAMLPDTRDLPAAASSP